MWIDFLLFSSPVECLGGWIDDSMDGSGRKPILHVNPPDPRAVSLENDGLPASKCCV